MAKTIKDDKRKWIKDPTRKLAWKLYGEGYSQREIAKRCSHKQAWVSKLIKEKSNAESIVQDAAEELKKSSKFAILKEDPKVVDKWNEKSVEYLLYPEQKKDISYLRKCVSRVT